VGDLDGDGEYEIVLHQAGRGKDNSQNGETDPPVLQAYKLDGTLLWSIDLGRNIREGAHYTAVPGLRLRRRWSRGGGLQDSRRHPGRAGKVIGDATADWRNESGRILAGPEFLTVFDGRNGAALATTNYIPARTRQTR
jgi:rhamnogalacturonan endolyase